MRKSFLLAITAAVTMVMGASTLVWGVTHKSERYSIQNYNILQERSNYHNELRPFILKINKELRIGENCKWMMIFIPGIGFPDFEIPDVNVPETTVPKLEIPETSVSEQNTPETEKAETVKPDIEVTETEKPTIGVPETITFPQTTKPVSTTRPAQTTKPVDNSQKLTYVEQVVQLVNKERVKAGLKELVLDREIGKAAAIRAEEIEKSFSHTRPNGSNFSTVLKESGIRYRSAGENIAWGQRSPEEVMNGWMNSEGHRANILNAKFTKIGVGYYKSSSGRNYWTQLFTN